MHVAGNTEHRAKIEHLGGADESEAMCAISVAKHASIMMIGTAPMTKWGD